MELGSIFLVVVITVIAIWLAIEVKKLRHKIFAVILIIMILLAYLSFSFIAKDNGLSLSSAGDIIDTTKLYFSWVGSIFGNIKTITMNAIKMDWGSDEEPLNRTIS